MYAQTHSSEDRLSCLLPLALIDFARYFEKETTRLHLLVQVSHDDNAYGAEARFRFCSECRALVPDHRMLSFAAVYTLIEAFFSFRDVGKSVLCILNSVSLHVCILLRMLSVLFISCATLIASDNAKLWKKKSKCEYQLYNSCKRPNIYIYTGSHEPILSKARYYYRNNFFFTHRNHAHLRPKLHTSRSL